MTAPGIDDASGSYGMPSGGFVDGMPVMDPTTDQSAAGANQMMVSCAAMTHTSRRCWARFVGAATTGALALQVTNGHDAHWGSASPVKPTLARTSAGIVTLTWPATITDALGVVQTVSLRYAACRNEDHDGFFRAKVTAANVVTITMSDTAHAASDFVGDGIFVEAG